MSDRLRLVVMGHSFVGKSSLVKRFLFDTFSHKYAPTVEDLFSRDYDINGTTLKVDILDTAGDAQFPAMRRLSIASAHAFLLVYSVTDASSVNSVKHHFEEIREQRKDFQEIPIVIAGNKADLVCEVDVQDVIDWVEAELPKLRVEVVECSARDDTGVRKIFKSFLVLSKLNYALSCGLQQSEGGGLGLRRNLSAYGRLKSPLRATKSNQLTPNATSQMALQQQMLQRKSSIDTGGESSPPGTPKISPKSPKSPRSERKFFGFSLSPFGSPPSSAPSASSSAKPRSLLLGVSRDTDSLDAGDHCLLDAASASRSVAKRSRSLIRRSSRKAKQQVQNVHNPEECTVS